MLLQFIKNIKSSFKNLDDKILKIMKYGLKFCFLILLASVAILFTYLVFVHSIFIYQIGLLIFEIALYFSVFFIISALAVDTICKQVM